MIILLWKEHLWPTRRREYFWIETIRNCLPHWTRTRTNTEPLNLETERFIFSSSISLWYNASLFCSKQNKTPMLGIYLPNISVKMEIPGLQVWYGGPKRTDMFLKDPKRSLKFKDLLLSEIHEDPKRSLKFKDLLLSGIHQGFSQVRFSSRIFSQGFSPKDFLQGFRQILELPEKLTILRILKVTTFRKYSFWAVLTKCKKC